MKLIKLLVLACWALACGGGGVDDNEFIDESADPEVIEDEAELGKLEQSVTVRPGYGVIASSTNRGTPCVNVAGAGGSQLCVFGPLTKVVSFRCASSFSGADKTLCETIIDQEVQALIGQYGPAWQFGRVSAGGTVVINKVALAGASTTSILPYVALGTTFGPALSESSPMQGTWHQYTGLTVDVDWAKVDSTFSNAGDRLRVKGHTLGVAAAWAVALGVTTAHTDRKNSRSITATTAKQTNHSTADRCRVTNYSTAAGPLQFGPAC